MTGMLSPTGQASYLSVMQGLTHHQGSMPTYHGPSGYEFLQNQPRQPWNSPPSLPATMPPPPGMQFGPAPSVWPPRPDGQPANTRKRRRRASSISSNGGNSDTGYTSGLSSPAHASPGQNKPHEKSDGTLSKSRVRDLTILLYFLSRLLENIASNFLDYAPCFSVKISYSSPQASCYWLRNYSLIKKWISFRNSRKSSVSYFLLKMTLFMRISSEIQNLQQTEAVLIL